jgi:hypothetical protein
VNGRSGRVLRLVAATLILAGGIIHLRLNLAGYATVDIGRTFLANAGASAIVAAYLVLRRNRIGPIVGLALSGGSLLGLGLTRVGDGLLGFRETGLNPAPDALLTVITEALAATVLVALLLTEHRRRAPVPPRPQTRRPGRPLVARTLPR